MARQAIKQLPQRLTDSDTTLGILHRQLSDQKGNKLYLSFIADYAHAKAFRAKNGYNQAPKHWEDIRVEVFIQ